MDINFVLGKLFKAFAQNRIPPRNAANLAFVGKLLLLSLRDLKDEYEFEYEYETWKSMERNAIPLSNPPSVSPAEQQSAKSAAVVRTDGGTAASPVVAGL